MKKPILLSLLLFVFIFTCMTLPAMAADTLTLNKNQVRPGEEISVTIPALEHSGGWVGFFKTSSANNQYISYTYLNSLSGPYKVTAPKELGSYNFRVFGDSGYGKLLATSQTVQLVQYTPQINVSKTSFSPQENMVATYSDAPIYKDAWIGLYKVGAANTSYLKYEYLKGTSGSYSTAAPLEAGQYEFRIFLDGGYTLVGKSQVITVGEYQPSITLSTSQVTPGQKVTASYSNGSTVNGAWIGFYQKGNANTAYISYVYTQGKASGSYEITAPNTPGQYEFRLFKDNGYTMIGTSPPLTVGTAPAAQTPAPATPPAATNSAQTFDSGVRMEWKSVSGLGYRIFRSTDRSQLGISVTDFYIQSTRFVDVNVEPDTEYHYTVKPVLGEANPLQGIEERLGDTIAVYTIRTGSNITKTDQQKSFIILQLDNPYMIVNGVSQEIDPGRGTTPIIISSRTMVPIRAIVEAMGGTVGWEPNTSKITLRTQANHVEMWLNRHELKANGMDKRMDVVPVALGGRTFVPVRFASENLNAKADWINSTREVVIIYVN